MRLCADICILSSTPPPPIWRTPKYENGLPQQYQGYCAANRTGCQLYDDVKNCSYFNLFDIKSDFVIDLNDLAQKYRRLQHQWHPDRTPKGLTDKEAADASSHISCAYKTLQNPVSRAKYLLATVHGLDVLRESSRIGDVELLENILEVEERLSDDSITQQEISILYGTYRQKYEDTLREVADCFERGKIEQVEPLLEKIVLYSSVVDKCKNMSGPPL